jgi:hypothetical protein
VTINQRVGATEQNEYDINDYDSSQINTSSLEIVTIDSNSEPLANRYKPLREMIEEKNGINIPMANWQAPLELTNLIKRDKYNQLFEYLMKNKKTKDYKKILNFAYRRAALNGEFEILRDLPIWTSGKNIYPHTVNDAFIYAAVFEEKRNSYNYKPVKINEEKNSYIPAPDKLHVKNSYLGKLSTIVKKIFTRKIKIPKAIHNDHPSNEKKRMAAEKNNILPIHKKNGEKSVIKAILTQKGIPLPDTNSWNNAFSYADLVKKSKWENYLPKKPIK